MGWGGLNVIAMDIDLVARRIWLDIELCGFGYAGALDRTCQLYRIAGNYSRCALFAGCR